MKKLIITLLTMILVSITAFAYSDRNAVFLDLSDDKEVNTQEVKKGSVSISSDKVKYSRSAREKEYDILLYKDVNHLNEEKKSVSKAIEKEVFKGATIGSSYSTSALSGEIKDSVSVYSKYEKEHFGLTTSYSQGSEALKGQGLSTGTVSFAPEISLNQHIKLKNVYSDNMSNNTQKNEIVLSLRPFKDDRLDLDLGAGQTFSTSNEPAKSQINLGTKFRF